MKGYENYQWFDAAEACADSAAPLFARQRWHWHGIGIPKQHQILATLNRLASYGEPRVSTGRLAFCDGKFGHEKAKESK